MNRPYISVIVPVYKTEKYLDRCVSSILKQTFTDFELLLIDDCSPDDAGAMCERYAAEDARIRVIHNVHNMGLSEVRNIGIRESAGDYVTFVDSDDCIVPEAFETLISIQQYTCADITIGGIREFQNEQELRPVSGAFPTHSYAQREFAEIYFKIRGNRTVYYMHGKLFRREIAETIHYARHCTQRIHSGVL